MDWMKRKFHIVQYIRIGKFGNRTLDDDMISEIPRKQSVKSHQFNKRAERSSCRFLPV